MVNYYLRFVDHLPYLIKTHTLKTLNLQIS